MGQQDKDRYLKELAIKYCLVSGIVPFLEVNVTSPKSLSDTTELLTDIDVLGIQSLGENNLRKILFDCKSSNRMSSINRAFWASGVMQYTGTSEAHVILKKGAVHNHRLAGLSINVDLHDETSFKELAKTFDESFLQEFCYQSSIERWDLVHNSFIKNSWASSLYDLSKNLIPLTAQPSTSFRLVIAELRNTHGYFDPENDEHVSIFLNVVASVFVLWAWLCKDIRRFYEPGADQSKFEETLLYYLWGGKEAYDLRQQIAEKTGSTLTIPAWSKLLAYIGLIVSAPQNIFDCISVSRELSFRSVCEVDTKFDTTISKRISENNRIRQFTISLSDYLVTAGKLPTDMSIKVKDILFGF